MRSFWSAVITSVLINVYGAMEPQQPLIFNVEAEIDVMTPGNSPQSVCLIESAQENGSGVLVFLDGKVSVLTAAHVQYTFLSCTIRLNLQDPKI